MSTRRGAWQHSQRAPVWVQSLFEEMPHLLRVATHHCESQVETTLVLGECLSTSARKTR
eukprot:CAMPEP_0175873218 /NCGR_PEP_ID=MMETSP0107_2-20121207/38185_1 /TAXON_ID=195067 ORGANISM="Goniomonas pacifica, Strain CCMP1869" /NCGR_SAMPLE_ID=MMETSP0107_2 /ASSEMBLY_ACC=CAM_ASM_000203 /LENGTH=58 /DNA_ID=CAMNT_0017191917 /DNA_START=842 /DNA_END=1018 /DNA_ORIENTATION=+